MRRGIGGALVASALALALGAGFGTARASVTSRLSLAPASPAFQAPPAVLAQRVIDRSWGPSEDSVYREVVVPGWRSEGLAMGLSAAIPGAGQLYAGETSGLVFLLLEAVGWTAHASYRRQGEDRRDRYESFAGLPTDPSSRWSVERWVEATQEDPAAIMALYASDREAFYRLIGESDDYLSGWNGKSLETRSEFGNLHDRSQQSFRRARIATAGVWLNHLVAVVDALRAARLNNIPLQRNLELRLKGGWQGSGPSLVAELRRSF